MKLGTDHHISGSSCTNCGRFLHGITGVDVDEDDRPNPGSITICLYCGHVMVFADDLTLRNPTVIEQIKIAGDPRILAIQRARSKIKFDEK
jgi:hypothetical protein